MKTLSIGLALLLLFLAGCNDSELGIKKRRPNRAPETILSAGPRDKTLGTPYKVHFYWSGSDPDGVIDHYDFIMVDHPAIDDSIAPGAPHPVVVTVPEPDDPRWTATFAKDSLFTTRADTLRRDPRPLPGEPPKGVLRQSFERWHTFFVRAVDNEGTPDLTPDYRSFNARTLAPTVGLRTPVTPGQVFRGPRIIVFNWDGEDSIATGESGVQKPIATRWVVIPSPIDPGGNFINFPDSLYPRPSRPWTKWARWDAADKSGVRAVVRAEDHGVILDRGRGSYMFVLQAMDDGGAVTPVFDYMSSIKNNVALVAVSGDVGARLTVTDRFLGTYNFSIGSGPARIDVAAGQPVRFRWKGDAATYGGEIVAYRYGWNIRNLNNDEEWEQGWSLTAIQAPVRSFAGGTQYFFVECRDNADTPTHAEIQLVVHPVNRTHELLLVDDTYQDPVKEMAEDARWQAVVDSLQARHPFEFNPARDIFDVQENGSMPPSIELVFDYKAIVWTMRADPRGKSALQKLARFWDPYVPTTGTAFNYLNIYLENHGKMWVSGTNTATYLWSEPWFNSVNGADYPVNVTNWDDPSHRGIDSVGTVSFLYKMGVEAFDVGSGNLTGTPQNPFLRRDDYTYGCRGLARYVSPGSRLQLFETDVVLGHRHTVSRPDSEWTADVDAPPPDGRVYTTEPQLDHEHHFRVTREDFRVLQAGGKVSVETDSAQAATLGWHRHSIEIVDQVGLWGAPSLEVEPGTWALLPITPRHPDGLRGGVEIFNMPGWCGMQAKPLRVARSLTVYTYLAARESQGHGLLYPRTADRQPVLVLGKGSELEPNYTRAYCSFEVNLLAQRSQAALAEFILGRHFRVGQSAN